jgi:UDP-N-acetylglucosamine:LPS N-acetylglucosamine transferase
LLVDQAELTADRLVAEGEHFLADPAALAGMAAAARAEGALHRSGKLITAVEQAAGR